MDYHSTSQNHLAIARRAWEEADNDNVGLIAAGVAFYGFLAFVPMLAAIVLGYGVFSDPSDVMRHAAQLDDILPRDVADIISEQLSAIAGAEQKRTVFGLILALAIAIYGAMKGAKAIVIALNIVHGRKERRGFFSQMATSALITLALVATALAMMLAITALGYLERLLPGLPLAAITLIRAAFWLGAGFAAACGLGMIYRYGPDRRAVPLRHLLPGSILATLGFVLVSLGFGFYVANFGSYNATYGALGAVVVMLMWLYLSAYVLLLGSELNAARDLVAAEGSAPQDDTAQDGDAAAARA